MPPVRRAFSFSHSAHLICFKVYIISSARKCRSPWFIFPRNTYQACMCDPDILPPLLFLSSTRHTTFFVFDQFLFSVLHRSLFSGTLLQIQYDIYNSTYYMIDSYCPFFGLPSVSYRWLPNLFHVFREDFTFSANPSKALPPAPAGVFFIQKKRRNAAPENYSKFLESGLFFVTFITNPMPAIFAIKLEPP